MDPWINSADWFQRPTSEGKDRPWSKPRAQTFRTSLRISWKKTTAAMDSRWSYCFIKAASSVGIRKLGVFLVLLQDSFQVPNPKICPTFYTNKTWTCFEDVFHESDFVDTLLIASFCQLTAPSPGRRFQYWTPWVCRNVVSSNSTRCRNDVLFSPILWYVKSATLIHCNPLCCSCYWLAWLGIRPWLLLELCSKSPGKAADASFLGRRH